MNLESIHHVAIICSDYQRSKLFYTEILGLKILAENYRESRDSYKLDLYPLNLKMQVSKSENYPKFWIPVSLQLLAASH
ncbi:glyoxylase I family protein [Vibrio cincinnatiensis]|nr:glyoxylase I family protein [Vibrio cincinnatiensis]